MDRKFPANVLVHEAPIKRRARKPVECPDSRPELLLLAMTPGYHVLKYRDPRKPRSNAKPQGASELQLFVAITDSPNAPIAQARYRGKFTRNPVNVQFEEGEDGKIATHYGRWVSARGENGPWSAPLSMRIAAVRGY